MKQTKAFMVSAFVIGLYSMPLTAQADPEPPLASPLTFDKAIAIALEAQPGTIEEVALDRANGRVIIDIEVLTKAGDEVEFALDAQSGEILWSHVDDDPSNDPGQEVP